MRRAVTHMLTRLDGPVTHPDRLRELRGGEVLETIGTKEARALLARLAKGADSRLTREAKAALSRASR